MSEPLDELRQSNGARLSELARKGAVVQGLGEAYTRRLLEHLVGDGLEEVQATHELWVAAELDRIEAQANRDRLTLGGAFPVDRSRR